MDKTASLRGTVLFVDDGEAVRYMARMMLEKAGFRVLTAEDGVEAVEVFSRHADEIGLVILDLNMPRMGGEETYGRLVEIQPGVRVVLSSGYEKHEVEAIFAGKRLAGVIQKPYQYEGLIELVNGILKKV